MQTARWVSPLWIGLILVCWTLPVFGQTPLEKIEQQIRTRTDKPASAQVSSSTSSKHDSGYLGLVADDQNDRGRGVRVLDVQHGSPAEKSGFQRHDLIVSMIGVRVRQMSDLSEMLGSFEPGDHVDFEVLRDGVKQEIRVVLGRRTAPSDLSNVPEMLPLPEGEPMGASAPVAKEADCVVQLTQRVDELERQVAKLQVELDLLKKRP